MFSEIAIYISYAKKMSGFTLKRSFSLHNLLKTNPFLLLNNLSFIYYHRYRYAKVTFYETISFLYIIEPNHLVKII